MSTRYELWATLRNVAELRSISDDDLHDARDAILAAGYRKPRVITTVEELEALPRDSVVRDNGTGYVWDKGDPDFWWRAGRDEEHGAHRIDLPATVLYEPEVA